MKPDDMASSQNHKVLIQILIVNLVISTYFHLVRVHSYNSRYFHPLSGSGIDDKSTSLKAALVDSQVRQLTILPCLEKQY